MASQSEVSVPEAQDQSTKKQVTVSDVIEQLGLTAHHWYTIILTWWVWIFCGWTATAMVYLLDAAGERGSDWTRIASPADRLTMNDKSSVLFFAGVFAIAGNQLLGIGSDAWGRIFLTELCVLNAIIAGAGFVLARSKFVLMVLICLNPFLKDGAAMVTGSMLAEWLPVQWRGIFIVTLHAMWNVGRLGITILWALVPPTQHWITFFSLALVLPVVLSSFLRLRGWRYESPRWLAVSGNMERCITNLKLAAGTSESCEQLPCAWDDPQVLGVQDDAGGAVQVGQRSIWQQLAELNQPKIRWLIGVLSVVHFGLFYAAIAFFYWAIEYFKMAGLDAAIVPSMVAAPLGKIVANLILIVGGPRKCLMDRCPRIPIMQVGFFGFGVSILLLCSNSNVIMITAIIFVGHIFQEIIWAAAGVYMTEAFPTSVRNTACGLVFTVGQVGGICGSSSAGELMELWIYLPMVVMSLFLFAAGAVCCFLEDERGEKPLSDTVMSSARGYKACTA